MDDELRNEIREKMRFLCDSPSKGDCQFDGKDVCHCEACLRARGVEVEVLPPLSEVQEAIVQECDNISNMLLAKNRQYGDSAMNPLRIFSRANAEEQLRVRIDDKLSRIARGTGENEEDTLGDLIGYLVLLRARRRMK